jgi:hypothetical protein
VPLAVVKARLDFTSGVEDAQALVEAVRAVERRTGRACVWLVIDTVARTFGAGDENAAKDMGAYVQACDLIKDSLKAHLSIVHHCPRTGEKPRGSIALDGAVDATFKVSKSRDLHSVILDKENDTPDAGAIRFKMKSVELGTDARGKVTTAPVVEPDHSTVASFETADGIKVSLSRKTKRKAVRALDEALAASGQDEPSTGRRGVHEAELRRLFREAYGSAYVKATSLDTIVRREIKGLIEKGDAEKLGEWFFSLAPSEAAAQSDDGA